MSTTLNSANSLIDDMLNKTQARIESNLRNAIERQLMYYETTKQETFEKLLGNGDPQYTLGQQFKYLSTIGGTLQEMQKMYLELYGKPWDYVEPVTPVKEKSKRGRPSKK